MKRLCTLSVLLLWAVCAIGQNELIVESTGVGSLNEAIFGDTTATGERANPDRVYVLRRGTPYLLSGSIRWSDFDIHIKAEDGPGSRPLLIHAPSEGGESIAQLFRLDNGANLTIEGVHINVRNILKGFSERGIRVSGDFSRVVVDDCVIEEAGQSGFRLNADSIKVFVTNSIFNRIGEPEDPNNGRLFDNRGHPLDTLLLENCIVYDVSSRYYRNGGSNPFIINGIFNQNTFWGSGQTAFTFGSVENLTFTNNIAANSIFLAKPADGARYVIELDTFSQGETNVVISNNNFFTDQEILDATPAVNIVGDSVFAFQDSLFDVYASLAIAATGSEATNITEDLAFVDEPPFPTQFLTTGSMDTLQDDGIEGAGEWDFSDLTANSVFSGLGAEPYDRYDTFHDFSYPSSAASFTAGTEGQPIGADLTGFTTSVTDLFVENNILYYPNPAREVLYIANLNDLPVRNLVIFNLSGQALQRIVNPANNSILEVNLSNLTSGMYILTLVDERGNVSSRKFVKE